MHCGFVLIWSVATGDGMIRECGPGGSTYAFSQMGLAAGDIASPHLDCTDAEQDPTTLWLAFDVVGANLARNLRRDAACP